MTRTVYNQQVLNFEVNNFVIQVDLRKQRNLISSDNVQQKRDGNARYLFAG